MNLLSDVEPKNYTQAKKDTEWVKAMEKEFQALEENNTWKLTSLPHGKNAVGSRWVYKIKHKPDGTVDRYKTRLVAKGFTQLEGMYYHETFSPVAEMTTVRTILAVANLKGWPLHQLDVNNAFPHGTIDEEVYMEIPSGFYDADRSKGKVLRLLKSIYGLKQASRQWFEKVSETLLQFGFQASLNDYSRKVSALLFSVASLACSIYSTRCV